MEYIWQYSSPLGAMTMACDGTVLTGLWFDGQKHFGRTLDPDHRREKVTVFEEVVQWLDIYFAGGRPAFLPQLRVKGSPFMRKVCEIMLSIPYGRTMTYGHIARIVADWRGLPVMSAQAVGGAVGRNPISVIIPCHRVVGTGGSLTGYGGGIGRKVRLLELEGVDMGGFFIPREGTAL